MKKIALILVLIAVLSLAILYFEKDVTDLAKKLGNKAEEGKNLSENLNFSNEDEIIKGENETIANAGNYGGSGSGGSLQESQLNLEEKECGYYFEKYGICNGKCPSGKCVSEGRSCYCREM